MSSLKELRQIRLDKVEALKELGLNPYPASSQKDTMAGQVDEEFSSLEGKRVTVAGRVAAMRTHGKVTFIDVKDQSGVVQVYIKEELLVDPDRSDNQLAYADLSLLDLGDFVEATGQVMKTKRGETSVEATAVRILTKALRQMPNAWEGLKDKETRMRRRYLDTNMNSEVLQRYVRRSKFWQATRDFLNQRGFIEINTPVLEHTTGGADAKPFATHMDALDQQFYLRISHELPLKRLLGGGYEKVYDIGPRFRNEHYSDEHLPEHVAMEWYWAYADWRQGMQLMTEMYRYVIEQTFGKLQFNLNGFEVDLSKEWQEIDYAGVIKAHYGIDVFNCTLDEVKAALKEHRLEVAKSDNLSRGIDKLWKNLRKDIAGPAWLINTPLFISPLSKANPDQPLTVQRFQPVIAGSELGNGYSELNDPVDQLNRFMEQQSMREAGDEEAMMLDIDFVEMLEYGMPPACGWGYSERVFWIFEEVSAREGVPFPQMRAEVDEVTRAIYPEIYGQSEPEADTSDDVV